MIDKFIFLNDSWSWPIILGATVLFIVFVWKEWNQFSSARFYIKVAVALLAILSLAMIALKPAILNTENSGDLILLTEGYKKASLDSLKKEHKNIKILDYETDTPIVKELVGIDSVFILGHGLKSYDLWQLEGNSTKYIGGTRLIGIMKFIYKQEHAVGDKAIFQGLYSNPISGNKLYLEGAGGQVLDSIKLNTGTQYQFKLTTELKSAGSFVFRVVEKDSLATLISTNPIPLNVLKKEDLKVLILNEFPTFETKYLKNFLSEMNHKVIVRSQITKGKYKYEAFNTERLTIENISENLLESFDLLILDFKSFRTLSTAEKNAVETSIREYGLGVFIQPETSLFGSNSGLASFDVIQDNKIDVSVKENVNLKRYPFSFQKGVSLQPIQIFEKQILSAYKRIGQGKIGTSVLERTYELLLAGHTSEYQQLWTRIINAISKREIPLAAWSTASKMGTSDEPFQFQIRTLETNPIVLNAEATQIPLRQEIDIANLWTGLTYPKNTGWQQLNLQQDSTAVYKYYVANPEEWKTLRTYKRILENLRVSNSADSISKRTTNPIAINLLYFYLAFLFCIGFLWLEPKMRSY